MAADFLEVQKQIENVKNYKRELEEQLKQSEKQMEEVAAKSDNEEAKKFVQLQKEKVNFKVTQFCSLFCPFLLLFWPFLNFSVRFSSSFNHYNLRYFL